MNLIEFMQHFDELLKEFKKSHPSMSVIFGTVIEDNKIATFHGGNLISCVGVAEILKNKIVEELGQRLGGPNGS